jgi:competence protein ComEC
MQNEEEALDRSERFTGLLLAAVAAAWLVGIGLQLMQPALWPAARYLTALGLAALAGALAWRFAPLRALAMAGALLAGFSCAGLQASWRMHDVLDPALEGRDLAVTGIVASLPQRGPSGVRFRFDVEDAQLDGASVGVPRRLSLGWYGALDEDAEGPGPQAELRAGQRWRFTVRLRQPHGNSNPHGFDYELYLFEQGLRATGYVRDAPALLIERAAAHPVERLRQSIRDAIEARVADRRVAGVISALAVGDQGAIASEEWDVFRATGIAHLVSISGLHVTMFAWLAASLIGMAWRLSERLMLALPAPIAARWGGLLAATAYALLAGFGIPAQRTVLMLAAVALLPSLGVRWPWPLVLLVAATVVTAFDPWALLQPGFWLSFVAVGLLMASGTRDADAPPPRGRALVADALRTQAVATLGLAPLTLIFFQQISLVGFVANLVAIPMVTLLITPLALLGALAAPLWSLAAWAVQALVSLLRLLAALPGAVWQAPVAPWPVQFIALAGGAIAVLKLPWRLRAIGVIAMLPLVFARPDRPAPGAFELTAVDVGQGTAVLVRTSAHVLVVDAGPQYSRGSDAGARVLVPLLRAVGVQHVDVAVASHRDVDHVGGMASLLRAVPTGRLLHSLDADHPLLAAGVSHAPCVAGEGWEWDGVRFDVLHPPSGPPPGRPNARSCVIRVSAGSASALLPGDIEREQELALVASRAEALASSVLVVPHHGSRTSSSAPFLDAVVPAVAVIQSGYRNRFGHPAPDVTSRYRERGVLLHASPGCGAWTWRSDQAPRAGVCQRDVARRYWHHAAGGPEGSP